jgi:GNAT superfamily N-acetyltransferase
LPFDIRRLTLRDDVGSFDCGDSDLNEYIWYQALDEQNAGAGVVYLAWQNQDLVGFVSLAMSSLQVKLVDGERRPGSTPYTYFPALMMGRLAVDRRRQRLGFGTDLCRFTIAKAMELREVTGCQFVIVNAKQTSIPFYLKNGFQLGLDQPKDRREPFMYFKLPPQDAIIETNIKLDDLLKGESQPAKTSGTSADD